MKDNGSGWPVGVTLLLGAVGVGLAFAVIAWIAPAVFNCDEATAKECSEIVRNNGLAVAGVFAGLIGLLALHFNARRTHTDRLRLTNDTYVKAIEQLRSDSVEVRVGGMYALERIAHEEQRYHWPVIETLSAYIRERAPWPPREKEVTGVDAVAAAIVTAGRVVADRLPAPETAKAVLDETEGQPETKDTTEPDAPHRAPTDIQTALTIIGQRSQQWRECAPSWLQRQAPKIAGRLRKWRDHPLPRSEFVKRWTNAVIARLERVPARPVRLEPRSVDLRHANLRDANLRDANLMDADLMDANLMRANLMDANLRGANLRGADLMRANLMRANLRGANLRGADLIRANLMDANLMDANLRGAHLMDANLMDANLRGADLRGADLMRANLTGANLMDANLMRADLRGADLRGARFSKHPQELGARCDEANPPKGLDLIKIEQN